MYIFLYTADGSAGELAECNEGTLEWVPKTQIDRLNLWEGDRIFHYLLDEDAPFFSLKLRYQDDLLKEAVLDGKPLELLDLLREDGEPSGQVRWRTPGPSSRRLAPDEPCLGREKTRGRRT